MIWENTLLYFLQPGVAFRALRNLEFTNSQTLYLLSEEPVFGTSVHHRRLGPRAWLLHAQRQYSG